jgi:hypothetical protein
MEVRDRLRGWPPRVTDGPSLLPTLTLGSAGAGAALLPTSLAQLFGAAEAGDALTTTGLSSSVMRSPVPRRLADVPRLGSAGLLPASTPSPDRTWDDLTTSRPHRSPAPPRASACPGRGPARPARVGTDRVRGPGRRRWRWWRLRRPAGISGPQPTLRKNEADVRPAVRLDLTCSTAAAASEWPTPALRSNRASSNSPCPAKAGSVRQPTKSSFQRPVAPLTRIQGRSRGSTGAPARLQAARG